MAEGRGEVSDIFTELRELRSQFSSPGSAFNRKLLELQEKVDQQPEIIARQQAFLESVDRRESRRSWRPGRR